MTTESGAQPHLCDHCRKRPAAYVLDLLGGAFGGQKIALPTWAWENCVQNVLEQVLDVGPVATVCRAYSYQS